ncbi:P1 family peptidase [Paenibacillus jamilae]|uniref:P1 family peptidase n=1 Tax=Paenibacillus alvei TaxID=44250 RepID=A0ABT4EJW1_PAEAL|nr:P1 family peptidase [Paenibacillus alvei]MCY9533390.1 P1 family peptidase [Paenibacillus alvei]
MNGQITDVPGTRVGQAHDEEGMTGCTVVIWEDGAVCSVDVRGSAPGTRETDLLQPTNLVDRIHGIVLSGGGSFGLDAASGVSDYLVERNIGFDVGYGIVPIVPAAVLFDLSVGSPNARPDRDMGYAAASDASSGDVAEGNVGAGCGASVGKIGGFERAMKGGIGTASIKLPNGLVVGAIVAVNALGEIRDPDTRELIAGPLSDEGELQDGASLHWLKEKPFSFTGTNTTLAIVATNAGLTKTELKKVAEMTHDGFARAIYPVHTMYDGDIAFAASTGSIEATVDLVGTLAADVVAEAIARGVRTAVRAGGLLAYRDLACGDVIPAVHKNKQKETETYSEEATLQ